MDKIIEILIYAVIVLAIFILIREFWTWYWKINSILELLLAQNKLLKKILERLSGEDNEEESREQEIRGKYDDRNTQKRKRRSLKEMIDEETKKLKDS